MLQFESGPFAYVAIRNHLGLPPSSEQTEEKMAQLVKTWAFHAQKKLKKAKKLFDDKVDAAKAVPASAEKGFMFMNADFLAIKEIKNE